MISDLDTFPLCGSSTYSTQRYVVSFHQIPCSVPDIVPIKEHRPLDGSAGRVERGEHFLEWIHVKGNDDIQQTADT